MGQPRQRHIVSTIFDDEPTLTRAEYHQFRAISASTAPVKDVEAGAYGAVPEFVLLGGLVPDLLCRRSSTLHVGTTDIDVQVNLAIAEGSVNAARLECHVAMQRSQGLTRETCCE